MNVLYFSVLFIVSNNIDYMIIEKIVVDFMLMFEDSLKFVVFFSYLDIGCKESFLFLYDSICFLVLLNN